MAFTKFNSTGTFSLLVTGNKLETSPAFVYENGKKTDNQRVHKGKKIYRLRGALPLISGEVVPDGFIYLTSASVPEVKVGKIIEFSGEISVRAAKGFGLTCSLVGALNSEDAEFSLPEVK